ncbi:MAG: response regulator transcription factor [Negativicutes bacterium]|nr:response regulator transcription factor [Negativicutes bacterium]
MPAKPTILLVDDEVKITEVVKSYLENAGYRVICTNTGRQAMDLFEKNAPAMLILDLMLPDISGEEICKAIRKKSRTPIIMLTAKVEDAEIINGLAMGADDYMIKPFSPKQLVARVEAVLRRVTAEAIPLANEFSFNDGELIIDGLRHEVRRNGRQLSLTPNEYQILMIMAKYPTKTFTREELIRFALGDDFAGYDRIIDTHIKNIRQKLGDDSKNPRYILTVHGIGYKFGGE